MIRIGIEIGTGESRRFRLKKCFYCRLYLKQKRYRRFFIYKLWGVSSAGRASVLQAEGRRFETCTLHICRLNSTGRVLPLQGRSWEFDPLSRYWTISITDRILRYERRGIGSTPIWSTCAIYASIDVSLALQVLILLRRMHPAIAGRSISLKSSA